MVDHPYIKVSWIRWKVSNIFNEMAQYIGTKNKDQCKSLDERMKKKYLLKREEAMDILDMVKFELTLGLFKDDERSKEMLIKLEEREKQDSGHMEFLR